MKGLLKGVAALALVAAFSASSAQAQGVNFGIAGTGLFSLETGGGSMFGGTALVGFGGSATSPLGFRVDGTVLHKNGITPVLGTVDVVYTFATAATSMFHPYLLAGGGVYHQGAGDVDGSGVTKPMAKAGVGAASSSSPKRRSTCCSWAMTSVAPTSSSRSTSA